jgi:hypothetical protein
LGIAFIDLSDDFSRPVWTVKQILSQELITLARSRRWTSVSGTPTRAGTTLEQPQRQIDQQSAHDAMDGWGRAAPEAAEPNHRNDPAPKSQP